MRIIVAVVAASVGIAFVFLGLHASQVRHKNSPVPVAESFLDAFLKGDRSTMRRLLASDAGQELSLIPETALTGVTFRISKTRRDGDFATAKVTFLTRGDFLRGQLKLVLTDAGWRVRSLDLDDRREQRDAETSLFELDAIPGVEVNAI